MEMKSTKYGYYSGIIGKKTIKLQQQQKKSDVEGKGAVNERTAQWWF
jgi:hypothetical protein